LAEKHRLGVFEELRIFEPKRKTNRGENYVMMNFIACIVHLILLG
jgi:hypothetical protein